MAVTSQNGYSANDRSVIATYTVPGATTKLAIRKGDVSVVLLDLAAWIHANIAPIDTGQLDDWGYAERTIRGSSTTLSNHASGTAIDIDALKHPLGVTGTWSAEAKQKIHARLSLYGGVIRWGEDYGDPAFGGVRGSRLDGMHFEINAGAAAVKAVADKIRAGQIGGTPTSSEGFLMALSDAEQREILDGIRKLKPGVALPGRGAAVKDILDDHFGWSMTGAGRAADALVEIQAVKALLQKVASTPGTAVAAGSLSDSDVQRVAQAVVTLLGKKASA